MPGTKNIAEECSLISLNEIETSNERSSKKNPHEKLEKSQHSIESDKAKIKKDKITSLKQQAQDKISNVINLIDQKRNRHDNNFAKTKKIVIKP